MSETDSYIKSLKIKEEKRELAGRKFKRDISYIFMDMINPVLFFCIGLAILFVSSTSSNLYGLTCCVGGVVFCLSAVIIFIIEINSTYNDYIHALIIHKMGITWKDELEMLRENQGK
jgi:hypothetical protein